MKPNFTSISVVLDRSGSMGSLVPETLSGFNTFLTEQKKVPGEAVLTLATFASDYTLIHDCTPIQDVPELTPSTYRTGGYTALLDAIARTINATGTKLAAMKEEDRPSQVMLVIITDGEENASKEFAHSKVMEMIKHQQEKYSWSVIYLGANHDAFAVSSRLGVSKGNTMYYQGDPGGVKMSYGAITNSTTAFRSSGAAATMDFFVQPTDTPKTTSTPDPKSTQ